MKESSSPYAAPAHSARPRGARLLEAFSPKLSRRVSLFDHASFDIWIWLEADPDVLAFCERPMPLNLEAPRAIDFWVRHRDREELMVLQADDSIRPIDHIGDLVVRTITLPDLAAHRTWTANWQRILPMINATRGLLPKGLPDSILRRVCEPTALGLIEHDLRIGDPSLVRGAVFELLRTGRLRAPALRTAPLALHTLLEPVP